MAGYLVIGAGKFGRSIAKTLYNHNETVLVIDKNEELTQQIIDDGIVGEANKRISYSYVKGAGNKDNYL